MAFFCIHCKAEIDPTFRACPFCGEAITEFLRRHLDTPIDGKYQILTRLAVGGMGEVYKALHVHLNSFRVVKVMRPNLAADAGANERFVREARLATRINHPNVATLFDFAGLEDGALYTVWEYIEGINLHELIAERGPLAPRYAAMLAVQALHGLEAIHAAGVVHRDVSPENLMVARGADGEERVKIIDLGIAKSDAMDDQKTNTGVFVGKWKYCSPEHLGMLRPGERIDGRADLYSFGIVLYQMLTGVPPFVADSPHEYLMMHSSQQPRSLRVANPSCVASPELQALLFRALEKDRARRFPTARAFAEAIERIAPLLSNEAGAPLPATQAAEPTRTGTRVMPRVNPRAATVVTDSASALISRPPARVETNVSADVPRSRAGRIAAGAVVIALLAAGAWIGRRETAGPVVAAAAIPITTSSETTAPAAPDAAPPVARSGRLGINAYPWASVTAVRSLDRGEVVAIGGGVVTPASLELLPGRYEVTLSNPAFGTERRMRAEVISGREQIITVHFVDPANATVPDFGVAR